jgi:hypothetical protein
MVHDFGIGIAATQFSIEDDQPYRPERLQLANQRFIRGTDQSVTPARTTSKVTPTTKPACDIAYGNLAEVQ